MTFDKRRIKILAVDDEADDCELNKSILEAAGYAVYTAESARQARTLLEKRSFSILLVDLRLPDADGLELLDLAHAKDPHAVAVVLTAFTSVDSAVAAIKAGAYDFLTKPCPAERLVASIHRAAERYELSSALSDRSRELESMNETLDRRVQTATKEIFQLNERLKRYIKDLVETNNTQTRFLEDMAHELKNPLSVIWGYSSFLLRRPMSEWTHDELKRSLTSIHRNARHLQSLIDELLDSTRLAGHKIALEREPLSATEAVEEVLEGLKIQAEEKGLTLSADLPKSGKTGVNADRTRLRQILINLGTNAIKFTPEGGRVTIRVRREDKRTHFCVSDTGKGLTERDRDRIFDRFFQVRQPRTEEKRGLGLGLNIVNGLVKLHGGRIWVESVEGKGSDFHFVIPDRAPMPTSAADEDETPDKTFASPN